MSKILCVNKGLLYQGYLFAKSLHKYFDEVELLQGSQSTMLWDYPINQELLSSYLISFDKACSNLQDYDCIFAIEAGSMKDIIHMKSLMPNMKAKLGVQVLDYPIHALKLNTKDYKPNVVNMWNFIKPNLNNVDFIAHEKYNAIELLKDYQTKPLVKRVCFPVNPMGTKTESRENFIFYSGRLNADKGIHYVLSALATINKKITFCVIGNGYDYSDFAKHLGVSYVHIKDSSEENKWKMYHKCRFVICGADNNYITALCILEGLSVGRTGLVFDYEENRKHYNKNVLYSLPRNINSLASNIEWMWNNPKATDKISEQAPKWVNEKCSYDAWANKIYEMYEEIK